MAHGTLKATRWIIYRKRFKAVNSEQGPRAPVAFIIDAVFEQEEIAIGDKDSEGWEVVQLCSTHTRALLDLQKLADKERGR